jgi:hypothetical protein
MLNIIIKGTELFDESTNSFITTEDVVLELEHSLLAMSKWESKFLKPFLTNSDKTSEEILWYIRCMVITNNFNENSILGISQENIIEINEYINSPQSATTFGKMPESRGRGEIITSELVYYWMIAFNIPFSCESWHINRLFSLIRICNIKNAPQKKMGRNELAARNRELNAQRKAQFNTSG